MRHPNQETATLNVVVAALAILTGEARGGAIWANSEYRPGTTPERTALLLAAAAMQREVSLPLHTSDDLVREVAHQFAQRLAPSASEEDKSAFVLALDSTVQRWTALLAGRAEDLARIASVLSERGVMPLREVQAMLEVPKGES